MATTLTEVESTQVETITVSFPISKMEKDADGDLIVKGVATDGSVDSDYQIVDPDWSAGALAKWLETGGNVRMSHDAQRPVGKGLSVEIDRDGDGKHWVKSVIVDPTAQRLVEKGVLRAYSVGISHPVIKRDPTGRARGGIICGGELSELSIVDRPANPSSYLELAKAAGANAAITGILHEGPEEETVQKAAGTFSPSDLAKLLEHRRVAEKRDMDPDVGGGVDRDKIPSEDFVDPKGRRFPVVTAADVSDAVSSYGRAKPQIPMEKFQRRLTSIARRKGFESALPDSWSNDSAEKGAMSTPAPQGGMPPHTPPTPGAAPTPPAHAQAQAPRPAPHGAPGQVTPQHPTPQAQAAPTGHTAPPAHDPAAAPADPNAPSGAILAKDHMDQTGHDVGPGMNFCPMCGAPVDSSDKGATPDQGAPADPTDANGHMTVQMPIEGAPQPGAMKADVPGSKTVGEPQETTAVTPVKDAKKKPKKQGKPKSLDSDTEYYEKKPKKNGKVPVPGKTPTPDGLPATKSDDHVMVTAMLLKSLNVPSDLGALHDLTCDGFHPADAEKCHPAHSLKSIDVSYWQNEALHAASVAPLDEAARATERWQAAETLKNMATNHVSELTEARMELHKAFSDAQMGPGTAPVPTQPRAGQFKRPFIQEGHARRSPGAEGPNTHDVPSGSIAASDFTGGYLSSGHSDESPSNKSMDPRPIKYPSQTGVVKPVDYSDASRQAAKAAMNAIHDHISHTFPDLCPMGSPGGVKDLGHVPMGETEIPQPVGSPASKSDTVDVVKAATPQVTDLTALFQQMKDEFAAELRTVTKSLKAERKRNDKLQSTLDSMASMPDPSVAAFKGVALSHPVNKSATPVRTIAETAEQTQMMMMRELESQFRTSPDPAQREAAWSSLMKMRGMA